MSEPEKLEQATALQKLAVAARHAYRAWNPPWDGSAEHLMFREQAWRKLGDALAEAGLLP